MHLVCLSGKLNIKMASTSPSPNPSPTTVPPPSPATSPAPSPAPPLSNSSITTPPPSLTHPNQTSNSLPPLTSSPPNSSAPPPQFPVPVAPPPSPPQPLLPPATPPPTSSPPPSRPAPPLTSPPPATPHGSLPPVNSPPSPNLPPPPSSAGFPPQPSPAPLVVTSSSPPPPAKIPSTPSSNSPLPPLAKPPGNYPPSKSIPHISPPSPRNSSVNGNTPTSPLPYLPSHKPTAKSTSNITSNTNGDAGGLKARVGVAIAIVVGFVLLSLLLMAVWFARKRKKRGSGLNGGYIMPSPFASSGNSDSSFLSPRESGQLAGSASGSKFMYSPEHGGVGNSRPWFTYEELAEATNGFSESNLLGEGGFGSVYKGLLPGGREVAVKQLKIGGGQGEREFRAEVEIISRVHHRQLVSIVGYCICRDQRLLVYDYVPNNTLHYHLHGDGRLVIMDWETRVKVAAGAARGIAYLHEDCHPRIIHRDIKSSNILLDNNFDALVADFGLAKLTLDTYTHVTTRVMGTFGYVAPEYASSGKLTEKSDVYSYGVVLLELITGRKPVDSSQPLGQESLVEWARPLLKRALDDQDFEELVDPRLNKDFIKIEMFHMIEAAAACVRHLASKRPRMSQVARALDSIFDFSDLSNGMKPGQSEVFDSREHSAQIRILQRMAFGNPDSVQKFSVLKTAGGDSNLGVNA